MFRNRIEAGRALAQALAEASPALSRPVVLALPRGGVPIGLEIARTLHAPLDLVMVRKIGVPWQPELAAAAVVDGDDPQLVVNDDVVRAAGIDAADLEKAKTRELAEIDRRRQRYLGGRTPISLSGADAIVVDDGIATGATVRAALKGVRRRGPRSLTLAVPVAAPETVADLRREVDRLICLEQPSPFYAIGAHYADFRQVGDGEVVEMLDEARRLFDSPK